MTMWGLWCYFLFSVMGVASLINWPSYWCAMAITQYPSKKPHQNARNCFNFLHNYCHFSSNNNTVFIVDLIYTSLVMNDCLMYKNDPILNDTRTFWLSFSGVFHVSWRIFVLCSWNVILCSTLIMYCLSSCLDIKTLCFISPWTPLNKKLLLMLGKLWWFCVKFLQWKLVNFDIFFSLKSVPWGVMDVHFSLL